MTEMMWGFGAKIFDNFTSHVCTNMYIYRLFDGPAWVLPLAGWRYLWRCLAGGGWSFCATCVAVLWHPDFVPPPVMGCPGGACPLRAFGKFRFQFSNLRFLLFPVRFGLVWSGLVRSCPATSPSSPDQLPGSASRLRALVVKKLTYFTAFASFARPYAICHF